MISRTSTICSMSRTALSNTFSNWLNLGFFCVWYYFLLIVSWSVILVDPQFVILSLKRFFFVFVGLRPDRGSSSIGIHSLYCFHWSAGSRRHGKQCLMTSCQNTHLFTVYEESELGRL